MPNQPQPQQYGPNQNVGPLPYRNGPPAPYPPNSGSGRGEYAGPPAYAAAVPPAPVSAPAPAGYGRSYSGQQAPMDPQVYEARKPVGYGGEVDGPLRPKTQIIVGIDFVRYVASIVEQHTYLHQRARHFRALRSRS